MPKQLNEFAPDQPNLGADQPLAHDVESDNEGAMAKADLFKLAKYSLKLFKQMHDDDQLEGWVQAKITKAADYIASVYHYLEYEMKFSEYGNKLENSDVYSESEKLEMKNKLMEAKEKLKTLKVIQADVLEAKKGNDGNLANNAKPYDKVTRGDVIAGRLGKDEMGGKKKGKKVEESMGGEQVPCEHCGGTGHTTTPAKTWSPEAKAKAAKYNQKAKAYAAAAKRIDANKNGIPDDEEAPAAKKPAAKKAAPAKKEEPAKKAEAKTDENQGSTSSKHSFGQGIYENEEVKNAKKAKHLNKEQDNEVRDDDLDEGNDGNLANNAKPYDKVTRGDVIAGRLGKDEMGGKKKEKKVKEAEEKCNHTPKGKKCPVHGLKECGMYEGKDEGKPGKNFAKIAKDAGKRYGSKEAGERVAGAVRNKLKKAGKLEEGVMDDLSNFAGDLFNTDASLERRSPQLQQLILMRKKYPDGSDEARQLDARIKAQKDRLSIDGTEVMGQGGMPKAVVDPATFKQQNPNFKYETALSESTEVDRIKALTQKLLG